MSRLVYSPVIYTQVMYLTDKQAVRWWELHLVMRIVCDDENGI